MANIFKEQKAVNEHPKRNNFDLSKKSNVSLKFGTLYPVYCQPVIPGDSFSIETAFNLKLLPVVFPVQTKMRAHMHYFYVRNKNLWSNWENWISNLVGQSEHPHPFISVPDSDIKSGSIHDFLGVPTTVVSESDVSYTFSPSLTRSLPSWRLNVFGFNGLDSFIAKVGHDYTTDFAYSQTFDESTNYLCLQPLTLASDHSSAYDFYGKLKCYNTWKIVNMDYLSHFGTRNSTPLSLYIYGQKNAFPDTFYHGFACVPLNYNSSTGFYNFTLTEGQIGQINSYKSDGYNIYISVLVPFASSDYDSSAATDKYPLDQIINFDAFVRLHGVEEYDKFGIPLYSRYLHINALPYRAYESIYYCYYNNNVLHPLTIGGQVQYNRYNTNLGDGADTTNYHLFQRNYELDFLTSALPSPQQGVAPLVGMTALGDITIEDENGITTAHADIDNDGTITKVVLTSPAASNEHARVAMNMASCGMSINDFRQTNALQRMLETNIRKGYRYMDFIAGHFGKEPEYRELDLPEFIGGFSRDVSVSTVVSNADTLGVDSGAALGEYGGYAQVIGGSNHAVRHYCDDFGFIIGILSVVPTPCYSQLLPKHMIAPDNFLDYPFPEFMQSTLLPITYKEVAPIQSYLDSLVDSGKRLEDTFGYQRPNYDLVSAVDEVHGEFRGSLRDYVINRIFGTRPELGQDFISINPEEINDIFVNRNPDEDTIIGEIGFSVHAKRPVPRVVIPNLGR